MGAQIFFYCTYYDMSFYAKMILSLCCTHLQSNDTLMHFFHALLCSLLIHLLICTGIFLISLFPFYENIVCIDIFHGQ